MNQRATEYDLNAEEFATLKEYYVDRIVDNMSMKDLVIYVTSDQQKWIDSLTFNEAITEIEEYFDEYFTETMSEVLGRNIND